MTVIAEKLNDDKIGDVAPIEVKLSGSKTKLKEGMMLYCPSHGPGKVVSIEEKTFLGQSIVFCQIVFEKDDLKLSIPLDKMKEMGIRNIISKDSAKKILDNVLNKHSKSIKGIWTRRMQEYEAKLYSGNAIFIAEVVRDLFAGMKDPNKSYGERLIFDKAFDRLVTEFSIALHCSVEEANKKILDVLNSNYKVSTLETIIEQPEELEGDFDDDDIDDIVDDDEDKTSRKSA